jgi:hypothetical protein
LILGDYSVDQTYIHLGHDNIIPLKRVDGHSNLWENSAMLPGNPIKDRFKYKYGLRKGQSVTARLLSPTGELGKNSLYCEESDEKQVESQTQFDVFHFPEEKYKSETVAEAIIFYLKWLLQFVKPSTISKILTQIESLHFISLCPKHVKECVNWIVEHALSGSDVHRFYLCIVLSHLNLFLSPLQLPNDDKTTEACDRLLQCLKTYVFFSILSLLNIERLRKIAVILVKNSSTPGWLTLAAYFCRYLGIDFVLDKYNTNGLDYKYDGDEYKKIVLLLLSTNTANADNLKAHQDLLCRVLRDAPTLDVALELFENPDVLWFFTNEAKKADFFAKFYQSTTRATITQQESAGAKLVEFYKIPNKIRGRMQKDLVSILLEYAKSDEELNDEHADIFLKLIISLISGKYFDINQVHMVLIELSESKFVPRQNLLLEILDEQPFQQYWHDMYFQRKVDICESWIMTQVNNKMRANSLGGMDKIVTVYEAFDAIMQSSLNNSNTYLARKVSINVVERILKKEDVISVLQAYVGIEECVTVVQECYISHVRKILVQASKVVKRPSKFLNKNSSNRYSVFILFEVSYNLGKYNNCTCISHM